MENTNVEQRTQFGVWGLATIGSVAGSVLIGAVGILLAMINYPSAQFEQGAAWVGTVCGSSLSIPMGIVIGGLVGSNLLDFLRHRNKPRPVRIANASAFVIGALISGVTLVPVGFFFFALGHI